MKRILIGLAAVVAILALGMVLLLSTMLDRVVRGAVESFAPQITKSEVRLDSVRISPWSGSGRIEGLFIGNPQGYQTDKAIYLGVVDLSIAPLSVFSERILIKRIYVRQPEFVYERKLLTSNINQLLKNIQEATGTSDKAKSKEGKPIKLEILELIIEEGAVAVGIGTNPLTVRMPRVELRGIGSAKGGITPDEAAYEVLEIVLGNVARAATEALSGAGSSILNLFGPKKEG